MEEDLQGFKRLSERICKDLRIHETLGEDLQGLCKDSQGFTETLGEDSQGFVRLLEEDLQ